MGQAKHAKHAEGVRRAADGCEADGGSPGQHWRLFFGGSHVLLDLERAPG